jgi:hypothetical protein
LFEVVLGLWEDDGVEVSLHEVFEVEKVGGERVCEEWLFIFGFEEYLSADA